MERLILTPRCPQTDGELNFGAPDSSRFSGQLSYTKTVTDATMWEIPVEDVTFDGKSCDFMEKSAIIDTGTSYMLLPPKDAQTLHALIPNAEQDGETFNVPCSTTMPIQIRISGATYNISSVDYVGTPVKGGELCASNIIGRQAFSEDQWLLGDLFLKNVYTVFDFDKDRIGESHLSSETKHPLLLLPVCVTTVHLRAGHMGFPSCGRWWILPSLFLSPTLTVSYRLRSQG